MNILGMNIRKEIAGNKNKWKKVEVATKGLNSLY